MDERHDKANDRDEFGWLTDPLGLAHESLAFAVDCRSEPRRKGTTHLATLSDGWVLDTGHDMELERIAAAMGSYSSCLILHDQVLPAARDYWLHVFRRVRPAIHQAGDEWRLDEPLSNCTCRTLASKTAHGAAAHLRDPSHWAAKYGARLGALTAFAATIGGLLDETASRDFADLAENHGLAVDCLAGGTHALELLWNVGIPPEVVEVVATRISPSGELVEQAIVRDVVFAEVDPDWLARFDGRGTAMLGWAVSSYCELDRTEPGRRFDWLAVGAHPFDVTWLMRSSWRVDDLREVASRAGVTMRRTAEVAAAWSRLGVDVTADDMELLVRRGPASAPRFNPRLVADLVQACGAGGDLTFAQAALVLHAAGSMPIAMTLLDHGIRTFRAAEAAL